MMKSVIAALILLTLAAPVFGKTHNETYPVPCSELWNAVQDTVKNSGNYSLVVADNTQMTLPTTLTVRYGREPTPST